MWSSVGSEAVDQVEHQSQALGLCTQAARPLIRMSTHLRFQVWVPSLLIGVCTHPGALGLCIRIGATDQRAHPSRDSGVGARTADLGVQQLGCRCVLGLLIQCSQSRG